MITKFDVEYSRERFCWVLKMVDDFTKEVHEIGFVDKRSAIVAGQQIVRDYAEMEKCK